MTVFDLLKQNTSLNISKENLKKEKGVKFLRMNRFLYDINKVQVHNQSIVTQENEYRVDYTQYQLNDMNYYWVILRMNNIDFLDLTPYKEYTIELNYKSIIDSIFPLI